MVKETGNRGMAAQKRFVKKVKNITEEEAIKNLKEKQRRLAEKMGWNDDWHKKKPGDLKKKMTHKSRVVHHGHGK